MSDRHAARFYRVLLCTLIGASLVGGSFLCGKTPFGGPVSVQAVELTNDSIREKEAQVKSIQEERAKIQSSISATAINPARTAKRCVRKRGYLFRFSDCVFI